MVIGWRSVKFASWPRDRGQARLERERGAPKPPCCACGHGALRVGSARRLGAGIRYMRALFWLVDTLIDIYIWLLIAQAVLSWLLAFGVINRYNRAVAVIGDFLYRVTEPALRPIRSFLPNFGGVDISPVILILILMFLRRLILYDLAPSLL
jgi:YggT family protein